LFEAFGTVVTRRAEALGYFGVATTLGQGLGAGFGYAIVASFGFESLYAITAFLCVLAALLMALLGEVRSPGNAQQTRKIGFERRAAVPSIGMVCLVITVGFGVSVVPLLGTARALENPGVYFLAYGAASVIGRVASRGPRASVGGCAWAAADVGRSDHPAPGRIDPFADPRRVGVWTWYVAGDAGAAGAGNRSDAGNAACGAAIAPLIGLAVLLVRRPRAATAPDLRLPEPAG
jgi:hypothetical protein